MKLKGRATLLRVVCLVVTSALLSACGYRIDDSNAVSIDVPFFKKDTDGALTTRVISELSRTGAFYYTGRNPKYELRGELVSSSTENIGYQYRRQDASTKLQDRLVPNEGRRTLKAKITLVDLISGATVYGPVTIQAESDYDFVDPDNYFDLTFIEPSGATESVLDFSLGQLDSQEGASLSSLDPAYRTLAERIADAISRVPLLKKQQ